MNRIGKLVAVGVLLIQFGIWAVAASPAEAQVPQPAYGEGPGVAGAQPRAGEAPVAVTALPRTGFPPVDDHQWGQLDVVGVVVVLLAAVGAEALRRGRRLASRERRRASQSSRALIAFVGIAGALGLSTVLAPATTADAQACRISGPADAYAPTLADFGKGGEPYIFRNDSSYWDGRGYSFGFRRGDWESAIDNPWGAYLLGGVVIATDGEAASNDLKAAVRGWTQGWKPFEARELQNIGDEAYVVRRLTDWDAWGSSRMEEVFLAFRRCNASAQIYLGDMPWNGQRPMAEAIRYARIIDSHFGF